MSNFALIMTNIRNIRIEEFNYPLPDERIARHPLDDRAACKLLVRNADGAISEHVFSEIPALLPADSMLVYNNTRVINARLRFRKGADHSGATIEIFCLEPHEPADYAVSFAATERCSWKCFVGNSKRWKEGVLTMPLTVGGHSLLLSARRADKDGNASIVEFSWDCPEVTFSQIIAAAGEIPIPPYLNRATESSDSADYQTVYSHIDGSVAAPTAGLHFTDEILEEISGRGIPRRELTLHVGAGTFQPVKSDEIGQHEMHSEFCTIPPETAELINRTKADGGRVICVGTTSCRTLESWAGEDGHMEPRSGWTNIFLYPGCRFKVMDGLVTNFHLPESTLIMLVSALAGRERVLAAYREAVEERYRFFSFGDAMFIGSRIDDPENKKPEALE